MIFRSFPSIRIDTRLYIRNFPCYDGKQSFPKRKERAIP